MEGLEVKKLLLIMGVLASQPAHATEKCTSMCHMFQAYGMSKVCPNFILNKAYGEDRKWIGNKSATKFERDGLAAVKRHPEWCNTEYADCVNSNSWDGTVCHYLTYVDDD